MTMFLSDEFKCLFLICGSFIHWGLSAFNLIPQNCFVNKKDLSKTFPDNILNNRHCTMTKKKARK